MSRGRRRPRLPATITVPSPWRRRGLGLIAGLVAFVGWIWLRGIDPRPASDDLGRYHDRSFQVVQVVDGDTLDIDAPDRDRPATRIRLWGVDTPEVTHGRDEKTHFGPEAAEFAERTLAGRRVHVVLSPNDTRDRFGRLLAYVHLERGGPMFNEMLLDGGFAYADPRFDHLYKDRFAAAERLAQKSRKGLWADVTPSRMPAWRQRREERHQPPTTP